MRLRFLSKIRGIPWGSSAYGFGQLTSALSFWNDPFCLLAKWQRIFPINHLPWKFGFCSNLLKTQCCFSIGFFSRKSIENTFSFAVYLLREALKIYIHAKLFAIKPVLFFEMFELQTKILLHLCMGWYGQFFEIRANNVPKIPLMSLDILFLRFLNLKYRKFCEFFLLVICMD